MKCAKCGALIGEGSTICPGCNTLVSELEMNNLLVKENTTEGVQTEQVVEVAPTAETPVVEVAPATETPIVEPAPVVEVAPAAETPVVETAPVVEVTSTSEPVLENPVQNIADVAPVVEVASTPVVQEETPVVEVKPEEITPVVEPALAAEVTPVVENVPEVIVEENPVIVSEQPVTTVTPETTSILDNPSADTPNDVVVTPASEVPAEPTQPAAPVEETPVQASENNTIINSVVSEVAPTVTNDTPAPTQGDVPNAEVKPAKEKGNGKVLIIVGIAVALIVIAALIGVFLVSSKTGTPEKLFNTTLSVVRNRLNGTKEEVKPTKVNLTFQTNLSSKDEATQALYDKLNKIYFETSAYADLKNEITNMDLLIKYNGKNMIDANVFAEKTKAYIKLNGVYDKFLSTEMTEEETTETDDLIAVVDGYMAAVEKALKEEYFTESEKTIKLDNKDEKVKANTLVINDKNISYIAKNVIKELKANTAFMTSYANLGKMTAQEAIDDLDMALDSFKNTSDWTEDMKKAINYEITIYTKGFFNTPVGFGIVMPEGAYTAYFTEQSVVAYTTVEGKEVKLLDVAISENKYNVNLYVDEEVLSFIVGYSVEENPSFTKPDTSNSVKLEELSDEDMKTITTALMQNEGMTSFMNDFADIIQMIQMLMGNSMPGGDMMGGDAMDGDMINPDGDVIFESTPTMSDDLVLE